MSDPRERRLAAMDLAVERTPDLNGDPPEEEILGLPHHRRRGDEALKLPENSTGPGSPAWETWMAIRKTIEDREEDVR